MNQPIMGSAWGTCLPGASGWLARRCLPLAPSLPATSKASRTPGPPGQDGGGGFKTVSWGLPRTYWPVSLQIRSLKKESISPSGPLFPPYLTIPGCRLEHVCCWHCQVCWRQSHPKCWRVQGGEK